MSPSLPVTPRPPQATAALLQSLKPNMRPSTSFAPSHVKKAKTWSSVLEPKYYTLGRVPESLIPRHDMDEHFEELGSIDEELEARCLAPETKGLNRIDLLYMIIRYRMKLSSEVALPRELKDLLDAIKTAEPLPMVSLI